MMRPGRDWEERRKRIAERRPHVRVDSCVVSETKEGFHVVIEGFGLVPAVTPPLITIGGVALERPRFEEAGRRVTGSVPERPRDDLVLVELGYARAEGRARLER